MAGIVEPGEGVAVLRRPAVERFRLRSRHVGAEPAEPEHAPHHRSALEQLPPTLRQTNTTLDRFDELAQEMGPTLQALRPAARALGPALEKSRPFFRETVEPLPTRPA